MAFDIAHLRLKVSGCLVLVSLLGCLDSYSRSDTWQNEPCDWTEDACVRLAGKTGDRGHSLDVKELSFVGESRIVSAGWDRHIIDWNLNKPERILRDWELPLAEIRSMGMDPMGCWAVTSGQWGSVQLWDISNSKQVFQIGLPAGLAARDLYCTSRAKVSAGIFVEGRENRPETKRTSCYFWDATGRQRSVIMADGYWPITGSLSPSGRYFILVGDNRDLICWSVDERRPLRRVKVSGTDVKCLCVSPDESMLAIGFEDGTVRVYDLGTLEEVLLLRNESSAATAIAFTSDSHLIAVGLSNGAATIWEIPTGRWVLRRSGMNTKVTCLAFSPRGDLLAAGGMDGTILVWNLGLPHIPPLPSMSELATRTSRFWQLLGALDAQEAFPLVLAISQCSETARIAVLDILKPRVERIRSLISDLDADDFTRRERASHELIALGSEAESELQGALHSSKSAEVSYRIKVILSEITRILPVRSEGTLRRLRVMWALKLTRGDSGVRALQDLSLTAPSSIERVRCRTIISGLSGEE
jgi:WD40 repeat protein